VLDRDLPWPTSMVRYICCDVFSAKPFGGNSLAVVLDRGDLSADEMQRMTEELRHFETIFLDGKNDRPTARIFSLHGELPFAGHPLLGAACTLHRLAGTAETQRWSIGLSGDRRVDVETRHRDGVFTATLDQGRPEVLGQPGPEWRDRIARAFDLDPADLAAWPLEVISTGLRYLVVPVRRGLERARIVDPDLDGTLAEIGAELAYLVNVDSREGRHWNNDGIVEDVATGSAAGVVAAYFRRHGLAGDGESWTLAQGHFIGRPSGIEVTAEGPSESVRRITVAGDVAFVGEGVIVRPDRQAP